MSSRLPRIAFALLSASLLLTGCAADATPEPTHYIGQTLHQTTEHLIAPNVVDLGPEIANTPSSYNGASDPSSWVVVAACYASNPPKTSTVGVVPTTAMTDVIRRAAKEGEYNKLMVCNPWK